MEWWLRALGQPTTPLGESSGITWEWHGSCGMHAYVRTYACAPHACSPSVSACMRSAQPIRECMHAERTAHP
eukprot:359003-Chlamydomonas_euryale.AAC.3